MLAGGGRAGGSTNAWGRATVACDLGARNGWRCWARPRARSGTGAASATPGCYVSSYQVSVETLFMRRPMGGDVWTCIAIAQGLPYLPAQPNWGTISGSFAGEFASRATEMWFPAKPGNPGDHRHRPSSHCREAVCALRGRTPHVMSGLSRQRQNALEGLNDARYFSEATLSQQGVSTCAASAPSPPPALPGAFSTRCPPCRPGSRCSRPRGRQRGRRSGSGRRGPGASRCAGGRRGRGC